MQHVAAFNSTEVPEMSPRHCIQSWQYFATSKMLEKRLVNWTALLLKQKSEFSVNKDWAFEIEVVE